jgi:hypothetical protein
MILKKDHLKQNLHTIIFQQSECQFHNTVINNHVFKLTLVTHCPVQQASLVGIFPIMSEDSITVHAI